MLSLCSPVEIGLRSIILVRTLKLCKIKVSTFSTGRVSQSGHCSLKCVNLFSQTVVGIKPQLNRIHFMTEMKLMYSSGFANDDNDSTTILTTQKKHNLTVCLLCLTAITPWLDDDNNNIHDMTVNFTHKRILKMQIEIQFNFWKLSPKSIHHAYMKWLLEYLYLCIRSACAYFFPCHANTIHYLHLDSSCQNVNHFSHFF